MTLQPPSREEVATRWRAVTRGEVSREDACRWAEPLMFAEFDTPPDVLVMQAVQYLHGFDMTYRSEDQRLIGHGPPGAYVRTLEQIEEEFVAWVDRCAAHDADPEDWLADRRREAEAPTFVRNGRATRDARSLAGPRPIRAADADVQP